MTNNREQLIQRIEDVLIEAERGGMERETVARTLEQMATVTREGYTEHPTNRGDWWRETHGSTSVGREPTPHNGTR